MSKIMVVDDEKSIRKTFEYFLKNDGHEVYLAEDTNTAKNISLVQDLDLVITDIIMPKSTGIELLKEIKSKNPDIPVIIMTGEPTVETAKEAVKRDAHDYLIKPVSKGNLLKATAYALEAKKLKDEKAKLEQEKAKYSQNLELLVQKKTVELQKAVNGTIETIAKILEKKDPYTAGHVARVGSIALAIAKKMELSIEQQKRIYFSGNLHDIGKLLIASEILSKPGKLSPGEFEVIKEHVQNGYELTKDIKLPWQVSDIILQHHERIDGSGYPNGLKGNEIQLGAKILAVADVIEAMTAHRPYRAGFGIDVALDEIKNNAGKLYDKEVSDNAIELFEKDKFNFKETKNVISL